MLPVLFLVLLANGGLACSFFNLFPYDYLETQQTYHYPYWKLPDVTLDEAKDEAVMLIGGKHCLGRQCPVEYRRKDVNRKLNIKTQTFTTNDHTIKFFTKYGFCRSLPGKRKMPLPTMLENEVVTSAGAVAMPDGRVIICGGVLVELTKGGRVEARNTTDCWYWVHNTTKLKRLEFYSKLPYRWLGPFTPNQMQLVQFKLPGVDEETKAFYAEQARLDEERLRGVDNAHKDYDWDVQSTKSGDNTTSSAAAGGTTTVPTLGPVTTTFPPDADLFGDNAAQYFTNVETAQKISRMNKFFRIVIVPWPSYTDAYRIDRHNLKAERGGEVIIGHMKVTIWGPRIYWTKAKLDLMPLGYGGCFVAEPLFTGDIRIHTFGGRELAVDRTMQDLGWSQNVHDLVKYARYFDIGLNKVINVTVRDNSANSSGEIKILTDVTLPRCGASVSTADDAAVNARKEITKKFLILEEDRIFHTCHRLPVRHFIPPNADSWENDIILVGGGTGVFFDRERILEANYDYTEVYRSIARYDLKPDETEFKECLQPRQTGKGRWIPEDKTFGYGLNIPRTRHASEIIKHQDVEYPNVTHHSLFVFGGYTDVGGGSTLDSVERFDLGKTKNFYLYDNKTNFDEWRYRLPWPLMDITTVKIPVEWLPPVCYAQWKRDRALEIDKLKYATKAGKGTTTTTEPMYHG